VFNWLSERVFKCLVVAIMFHYNLKICLCDYFLFSILCVIRRFIAERGESGQLVHVEKIDEAYKLKSLPQSSSVLQVRKATTFGPEALLSMASSSPRYFY